VRQLLVALALALVAGIVFPATGAAAAPAQPPGTPPPGGVGIRLLDAPVSTAQDPRAKTYIVDHLAPGAVITRRVEITNTSSAVAPVTVYAAAATITDGTFVPADGHTQNDVSTWTATDRSTLSLPPGGTDTVTMTISVPPDASPGENYAVLWLEQIAPAPAGGGLAAINRVGIRIYLSVGPGGAPPSSFTIDSLTAQRTPDGRPQVIAQLHNTGGRALDIAGHLTLSDGPGGLSAGPFPAQGAATLAPGAAGQVAVLLDRQVPDGPWKAVITLRSGLVEQTSEATITFPQDPGTATPVAAQDSDSGYLWILIAALSLLLTLVIVIVMLTIRRRRVQGPDAAPPLVAAHRRR
jgi:hypothetical protein